MSEEKTSPTLTSGASAENAPPASSPQRSLILRIFFGTLHWIGWWLIFTFSFILAGGMIGGVLFIVVGYFTHPDYETTYRASKGFLNGAEYFGIWAGGLGMVLCWIKAHREGRFL